MLGLSNYCFLEEPQQFNYILVDTPPVGLFGDASELGKAVDGVILVVAIGQTLKRNADEALGILDAAGANVVGSFVTRARTAEPTIVPDLEEV